MCRIVLIVGNQVNPALLMSLFGVNSIPNSIVAGQLSLLSEGDDYCERVNVLVNDLQNRYGCYLQVELLSLIIIFSHVLLLEELLKLHRY